MKITRKQLRQIINEELKLLNEGDKYSFWETAAKEQFGPESVERVKQKGFVLIQDTVWKKTYDGLEDSIAQSGGIKMSQSIDKK